MLLDNEIRKDLKKHRDVETGKSLSLPNRTEAGILDLINFFVAANVQIDQKFEENALSLTSRLSSEHFITLADLCNKRQQGSCLWVFENQHFKQWLLGSRRTLYCIGPRKLFAQSVHNLILHELTRPLSLAGAGKTFLS